MTQALYYQPSYLRLQERIKQVAPDLEIALYDEEGKFYLEGKQVQLAELTPEYFWMHGELFKSALLQDYFNLALESTSIKWLHTANTGLDILPYISLLKKDMRVSNNHSQAISIAEYVMGQVLAHYQKINDFQAKQKEKVWQFRGSREIHGSHWLIIGFGHIGQAIASRAKSFGVKISAIRRSDDDAGLADQVLGLDQLDQVLPQADVVVLACNANAETRNLVDENFLSQMKQKSVLVNIARGDLVVEDDLHKALNADVPAYAILDVFNQEPLPESSWMWHHPRLALSPHCSNASRGTRQRSEDLFIENLRRMVNGDALLNEVAEHDIV